MKHIFINSSVKHITILLRNKIFFSYPESIKTVLNNHSCELVPQYKNNKLIVLFKTKQKQVLKGSSLSELKT